MNLPRKVRKGENFSVMYDLWNSLIDYLAAARLVPGKRISLQKYPSGTVISAARQDGTRTQGDSASNQFEYSGPWSLYLYRSSIYTRAPGLIWTPDGAKFNGVQKYCTKPSVSSLIILTYTSYSGAVLSTMEENTLDSVTQQDPHYWDTHAILGRYDAQTDAIEQYHFSPIVFLIETQDFIIEP